MAKSRMDEILCREGVTRGSATVRNYLSGGMYSPFRSVPENVLAWITTHDLAVEPLKYHQRYVLKTPVTGKNVSVIDGKSYTLLPGDAMLIFPFQTHTNAVAPERRHDMLVVTFTLPESGGETLLPLRGRVMKLTSHDDKLLCRVVRAYQHPELHDTAAGVFALAEFLAGRLGDEAEYLTVADNVPAEKICEYIRNNYASRISVKTIAGEFGIAPSTVRRVFGSHFGHGLTPGAFLARIRLMRAAELLLHSDESMSSIAAACGFADQFSFSRAFRRINGISPLEYRKTQCPIPFPQAAGKKM